MSSLAEFKNNSESIFDSIKYIEDGIEVWYARELMVTLGYKSWQKFEGVISIAEENLESVVDKALDHINPRDNMAKRQQGGGRAQSDFRLSRLGSYHIALSCDSRGNERGSNQPVNLRPSTITAWRINRHQFKPKYPPSKPKWVFSCKKWRLLRTPLDNKYGNLTKCHIYCSYFSS
jgi:hypothetical protein